MKQSHSKHNVFSKVDHDKAFINTNYRGPKDDSDKEQPVLQMDIRMRLASKQLSSKLSGKSPVVTVATGLGKNNAANLLDAEDTSLFEDDNASIASNHSHNLEIMKKSPELIKIEDFMDELGKAGHMHEEEDDEDSFNSEDEFGEFVDKDRTKYTSTLDVHKKFMLKAQKKNTLANVKAVANMKIMSHKKKMNIQQSQIYNGSNTMPNSNMDSTAASMKNTNSAIAGASTGSMLGLVAATKSFMFLSKLSKDNTVGNKSNNNSGFNSPTSPASQSPQITSHKVLGDDSNSPVPYMASPGGYAYSSKHNLLHEANSAVGSPDGRLPLFGKAAKPKQIAHRAFTATTLNTLHSKYDTKHSVLSATKDHGGMVKSSSTAPAMYGPGANAENPELYHVPILKSVHGKKNMLSQLDKMFHSMTYVSAVPIAKPEPPTPAPPMTLQSLLGDQLLKANIPANKRVSDQALNTLINATPAPANYGPRVVEDRSSAAAIVAQLDRALMQQRRDEVEQKRRYESIAAAYSPASPRTQQLQSYNSGGDADTNDESYSMATFVTRLEQNSDRFAHNAGKTGTTTNTTLQLDFTKLNRFQSPPPAAKEKESYNMNGSTSSKDPYSIDVHALKLPDISSPQSRAYYQNQKQPILCIYSPAPLESRSTMTSPERGSPSPANSPPEKATYGTYGSSPVQLRGTLTSMSGSHAASSPAIMYISSPGMPAAAVSDPRSIAAQSTHSMHNKSSASLPIVSSSHGASYHNLNNHLHHQYQTQADYQQALHPQTQAFLTNMLTTNKSDFHDDPRNYRGGIDSAVSATSVADIENSIYDYEAEYADLTAEPVGDRGSVNLSTDHNRFLLPANTVQQGGNALLDLGYQYQHSTNTYVHKEERNRSKFGQYERAALGDPYAADFSDRHLEEILDSTVGFGAPVIYIPEGAPSAEPVVEKKVSALQQLANKFKGNSSVTPTVVPGGNVNSKPKMSLDPGEVVKGEGYKDVRTVMQHPRDTPLNAIHYRGGAGANLELDSDDEEAENGDSYHQHHHHALSGAPHRQSLISADNSTLQSPHHASSSDIKREINDYIAMLASHQSPPHHHHPHHIHHHSNNLHKSYSSAGPNDSTSLYTGQEDNDNSTAPSYDRAAEKSRVKLWDKLNNRYSGDKEGEFVRKKEIKAYIYDGIKQDTQIMKEYLAEMDEGW